MRHHRDDQPCLVYLHVISLASMQQFERPEERYREWGSECPACPHTPRFPLESRADAGEERHPPVHPPVLAHCSEPGSPLSHPMRAKAAGAKLWRSGPRRAGTAEGMKKLAGTAILFLAAPSSSPLYLCLSPAILSLSLSLSAPPLYLLSYQRSDL